ncbi:hypothetical protein ACLOJK_019303 [Asimina triloba]
MLGPFASPSTGQQNQLTTSPFSKQKLTGSNGFLKPIRPDSNRRGPHPIPFSPAADHAFDGDDAIPSLQESFSKFLTMYPKFQSSEQIDQLRDREYSHLADASTEMVCDQIAGSPTHFKAIRNC